MKPTLNKGLRAVVLEKKDVEQIDTSKAMYLRCGEVVIVRSESLPELGDHVAIITGTPVLKPHGLRPQTVQFKAPRQYTNLLSRFGYYNGVIALRLRPEKLSEFMAENSIVIKEGRVFSHEHAYLPMTPAQAITEKFEAFRMPPTKIDQYQQIGKGLLQQKIQTFVDADAPIDFVLLGFPFKSTNDRDKVLGDIPDMAEDVTLQNFADFNSVIKTVYPKGVNVNIVSDGFVFNDLLGVTDKTVYDYAAISKDMGKNAPVLWHNLNSFYHGDLSSNRQKVVAQFGITAEKLEHDILFNPDVNYLYRGMIHFMEEELAYKSFPSRNQLQKAAKKLAREMMFRNEAYSNLVRQEFKSMIRLSMHPSVNNGAKYSFQLIHGANARHSAWHSALLLEKDNSFATIHRKDAEAAGHELVYMNGKPNHFVMK